MEELEFKNYVQRLDRCRAVRFRRSDQAAAIADLFNASDYKVNDRWGTDMTLTLTCKDGEKVVRYGDFVVEGGFDSGQCIVNAKDFMRFEEQQT
jgi:hypothetical protein